MSNRKIIFISIISVCLIAGGIFLYLQKNNQNNLLISPNDENSATLPKSPQPTPTPSPLLNITGQSDLTDEAGKLKISDFTDDYQKLDTSLTNF